MIKTVTRKLSFFVIIVTAVAACFVGLAFALEPEMRPQRIVLQQEMLSDQLHDIRLIRVVYPPGYVAPPHEHPEPGMGYVVEGCMKSGFGDEKTQIFKTGESFVERSDKPHMVIENCDPGHDLVMLITFAAEKGQDILTPLK